MNAGWLPCAVIAFRKLSTTAGSGEAALSGRWTKLTPAALAAAASPSMSAPCSVGKRRLKMALYPIFFISATDAGVTAPAQATVVSSWAKLVIPGTLSFFTGDCAETTETLMTAMARNSTALFIPTPLTYERISTLLSAIYGDNSRGHHAGIGAHEVRNQCVEYSVRVSAGRLGNSSGITASGRCTYGQLHSLFKERIQCGAPVRQLRAIIGHIEQVNLYGFLGLRIDKIGSLRNWDSVLRPDRIVIPESRRIVAHDDDNRHVATLKTIVVTVHPYEIIRKGKRIPQTVRRCRIKYHTVLPGHFVHPVIFLMTLRLPGCGRR